MNSWFPANLKLGDTCWDIASNSSSDFVSAADAGNCTVCLTAGGVAAGVDAPSKSFLEGGLGSAGYPAPSGSA